MTDATWASVEEPRPGLLTPDWIVIVAVSVEPFADRADIRTPPARLTRGVFEEDRDPEPGLPQPHLIDRDARREATRSQLAYILLGILGVVSLIGGLIVAVHYSEASLRGYLTTVFGPIATLTGLAVGYFFGRNND